MGVQKDWYVRKAHAWRSRLTLLQMTFLPISWNSSRHFPPLGAQPPSFGRAPGLNLAQVPGSERGILFLASLLRLHLPNLVIGGVIQPPSVVSLPADDSTTLSLSPEAFAVIVRGILRELGLQAYVLAVYGGDGYLDFAVAFPFSHPW